MVIFFLSSVFIFFFAILCVCVCFRLMEEYNLNELTPLDDIRRRLQWDLEMEVEPAPAVIVYTLNQGKYVFDALSKSWFFVPPAQPGAYHVPN